MRCSPRPPRETCSSLRRPAPTATRWPRTTTACRGLRSSSAPAATPAPWCGGRPTTTCSPGTPNERRAAGSRRGPRSRHRGHRIRRAAHGAGRRGRGRDRPAGVQLRFEAAVAGVIPVIRVIQESLSATEITRVFGIVNGTTNYILTEMARTGASYEDALARAQELGYAEADPSDDVGGADAAAKMAILARLAFHTPVGLGDVAFEGIEAIQPDDLAYAKQFGLSLKLLGVAEHHDNEISVRVFPCFLYSGHPLAPVGGPFNAVMVESPSITEITMSGPGAGGTETASAVLGDLVSIVAGDAPVHAPRERLEVTRDLDSAFYLHLEVADRPGVLAQVADVLGRNEVSVRSVVQWGMGEDARLVMVMHQCAERRFYSALDEIATLDFLRAEPRAIRVIE